MLTTPPWGYSSFYRMLWRGWQWDAGRTADVYRFLACLPALQLCFWAKDACPSQGLLSDTERRGQELRDGEDCERFGHLGWLPSCSLPWKEQAANPTREGLGVASLPWAVEDWQCLCAPCSFCYSLQFCCLELQGILGAGKPAQLQDNSPAGVPPLEREVFCLFFKEQFLNIFLGTRLGGTL